MPKKKKSTTSAPTSMATTYRKTARHVTNMGNTALFKPATNSANRITKPIQHLPRRAVRKVIRMPRNLYKTAANMVVGVPNTFRRVGGMTGKLVSRVIFDPLLALTGVDATGLIGLKATKKKPKKSPKHVRT